MSLEILTAIQMMMDVFGLLTAIQMTKGVIIATDNNPDVKGCH